MLQFLLTIHNLFRWFALLLAIYALYNNYSGWKGDKTFSRRDKILNTTFVSMLDLQLLVGLLLYFVYSNVTQMAFSNMAAAMKDKELRFWAVEHITGMVLAVVVAHIGGAKSKRAASNKDKYRKAFVFFAIAVALILLSMPYFFRGGERPLNPFDHSL